MEHGTKGKSRYGKSRYGKSRYGKSRYGKSRYGKSRYGNGKNFISSEDAASEVVGNMLILSMTMIGISVILVYSIPMINSIKDNVVIKNVEMTYSVIDYRMSRTLLGSSPEQIVSMNLGGGSLSVIANGTSNGGDINRESYMVIRDGNDTFNIVQPMGKIVYNIGDRSVAYEGGGVWSKYSSGSVAISPPEFNYNGETLTLPMININGNDSVGGKGIATMSFKKESTAVLFPTGIQNKTNPLDFNTTGKLYVSVTSDYYDAWAEFISDQFYARTVAKNATTRTALIELRVVPNNFGAPIPITQPIKMKGLPKTKNPLKNFSFKLYGNFDTLNWDIRTMSEDKTRILIIYVKKKQPNRAELSIGYKDFTFSGINSPDETWGGAVYDVKNNNDGLGDYVDINMLDNSTYLYYSNQQVGANNPVTCQVNSGMKINGLKEPDYSWNDLVITASSNQTQPLKDLTMHYISKIAEKGDVSFYQCYPSNGEPKVPPSTILLDYDVKGDVTFLYITDNRANIKIS